MAKNTTRKSKTKRKTREAKLDASQNALRIVEQAIGEKLSKPKRAPRR